MQKSFNSKSYLNKIFRNIKLKKQYQKNIKSNIIFLNNTKDTNYKTLNYKLMLKNTHLNNEDYSVNYIINIIFSKTNTLFHVMDFSGNLKFFCSAGSLSYKGKAKKTRFLVFRDFYHIMLLKLKFLKDKPIALHLKNVGSAKFWIIKKLKKKFFIKIVRSFSSYPHNGCRKRKMRRKKFKKR